MKKQEPPEESPKDDTKEGEEGKPAEAIETKEESKEEVTNEEVSIRLCMTKLPLISKKYFLLHRANFTTLVRLYGWFTYIAIDRLISELRFNVLNLVRIRYW